MTELRQPAGDVGGGKLAKRVARQIEDDIIRAGWPVGEVLGSEPDLIARYGVSRAVFREAVRLVEHHEVAGMRRGPSGGLVVRAPDARAATVALVVYLEYVGTSVDDLLHARTILESLAASLAAKSIDEDGIKRLRSTLEDEATFVAGEGNSAARDRMHLVIAELSGNPALLLFIDVLVRLTKRYAPASAQLSEEKATALNDESARAHRALADAITTGDVGLAQHCATEHLQAMGDWLTDKSRATAAPGTASDPQDHPAAHPSTTETGKLAEAVAWQIREDIVRRGWPVGEVIGSEPDLLNRYKVSRSVLRESIRILEHHSIVTMRSGPGGGLVVTEPDPSASVEAMALYLDYKGTGIDELRVVRNALELGSTEIVATRAAQDIAAALEETLLVDGTSTRHDLVDFGHLLHTRIAELTGNPALAVFVRILVSLWERHSREVPEQRPLPVSEIAATVARTHRHIVEAILSGDGGLARHRMLRHLEALTDWWQ